MLEVKNLVKVFGQKRVLNGLSFCVKEGEICGLLGPNGAGKTTTLRLLSGFLNPNMGSVFVNKVQVFPKDEAYRAQVGYLPESNPLYTYLSVAEMLTYLAKIKRLSGQIHTEIGRVIKACGLTDVLTAKISTLSKGYRQRVGLAGALLGNPKILLLDEATSGLDPRQAMEIRKLIKRVAQGKLVLFSSHVLPEVEEVCQKILILNKGTLQTASKPSSTMHQTMVLGIKMTNSKKLDAVLSLQKQGIKVLKSTIKNDLLECLLEIESDKPSQKVLQAVSKAKLEMVELKLYKESLEDTYLKATEG